MSKKRSRVLCFAVAATFVGAMAAAATVRAERPPLPEEAFTACASSAEGDACSVQFRDQTITGTCQTEPSAGKLFCRPDRPPPRPDGSGHP